MMPGRSIDTWIALGAISIALAAASLSIGTERISLSKAVADWRSGVSATDSPELSIVLQQRLPRTLLALLAGAGLAAAGCAFQALLRNPLAEPYTLGVASAGAFGAWAATILGQSAVLRFNIVGFSTVQLSAFAFSLLDIWLLYVMAVRARRLSPAVLLLAGITMGVLCNAGIIFLRYFARPENLINMDRWLMGSLHHIGYESVIVLTIAVLPCVVALALQGHKFDQLVFGEELAAARGVRVQRLQVLTLAVGSFVTAIVASKVGPIGFVGLIVPHIVRAFVGPRHRVLVPMAAVAGGGFLCFCDILARRLMTGETPIGIVTALIGGPFFIYLLLRRRFTDWG
jgi:iron complex transport system permease protein